MLKELKENRVLINQQKSNLSRERQTTKKEPNGNDRPKNYNK